MKPNLYQLMESGLEPGETLLWTGHRHRRNLESVSSLVKMAFVLGLIGIPVTMLWVKMWSSELEFGLEILLLPVFIGGYALVDGFIVDPRTCRRTCYGITERRALIVSGCRHPEMHAVLLQNIETLEAYPNDRGHGSIKCYAEFAYPFGKINNQGVKVLTPLFRGVADVIAVFDLLERNINLQRAARVLNDDGISHWVRSDVSGR
jgi:hypothetical protein